MELYIKCFGTATEGDDTKIELKPGSRAEFECYDEKVVITISETQVGSYTVQLSTGFCLEENGKVNLFKISDTFRLPYGGVSTLVMPLYDATYKLQFFVIKESD